MTTRIKVKWQADDGYVGKDRPQVTTIDPADFVGLDAIQAEKLFTELMEDAFRERVTWECDDPEGTLAEIIAAAAELKD
jgi:hypothetical protein